jgi:hypothetical protein
VPAKKSPSARKKRAKAATVPRTGAGSEGKKRTARVPEHTDAPVPARAMQPGPGRPSPWPKVNAKAAADAPADRKPTPKRKAKAAKTARSAHKNRTNWI